MRKAEALKQRKELLKLIEEWTKAEVLARLGASEFFTCWAHREVELRDKVREKALGTSDFMVLAARWGMLKKSK